MDQNRGKDKHQSCCCSACVLTMERDKLFSSSFITDKALTYRIEFGDKFHYYYDDYHKIPGVILGKHRTDLPKSDDK